MSMAYRRYREDGGELSPREFVTSEWAKPVYTVNPRVERQRVVAKQGDRMDITEIVRRNVESGMAPMSMRVPQFADVSNVGTLQDALELVREAGEFFSGLPGHVREYFRNDPEVFVAAAQDPRQEEAFRSLGLIPATAEVLPRRGPDGRFIEDEPPPGGAQ